MFVNLFLLLIFLVCLAYLAVGLRRMESDLTASRREADKLQRQETELNGAIDTLQDMIGGEEANLANLVTELDNQKARKDELEVELKAAIDAPKQRLFVFDKSTLVHGKLWELRVVNDVLIRASDASPTASEWAEGRTMLVGSATDRDARHRTESRFPSGQGYRIMSVERFRRA